jgi:hypothetical protein
MRKLIALFALAALVAGPTALAKERNLAMIGAPLAPKAGQAWMVTITVKMDGKLAAGNAPSVRIVNARGQAISWRSRSTSKAGIFRARVVFPRAGTWRVIVYEPETGRAYEFNRMKVRAA